MGSPFETGELDKSEKEYLKSGEQESPLTQGEIDRQREETFAESEEKKKGTTSEEDDESEDTEGDSEGEGEEGGEGEGDDEATEEADDEEDEGEGESGDKKVSLKALQESRRKLKEQRIEKERLTTENKILRERADKLLEKFTSATPVEKPQSQTIGEDDTAIPSYEDDPAAHLSAKVMKLERQLAARDAKDVQHNEAMTQQDSVNMLAQRFQQTETEFMQATPIYNDAVAHLRTQRMNDFADMGLSPQQANQAWVGEVLSIANQAFEKGTNPAETLYKRAQRLGWKEKDLKGQEKVATIKKGQTKSSRMAGGDVPKSGGMTVDDLLKLPDDEFNAAFDKLGAAGKLG